MAGPVPCIGRGESLFVDAAPALKLHRISEIFIAHIDCDFYGFSVDALASIRDRLQLGCMLMFNDYYAYCADNKQGERSALREFCEAVPFTVELWFAYQYGGQAFSCVEES